MDRGFRLALLGLIGLAVWFGFTPKAPVWGRELNFSILHIFLFNLTCGGALIITDVRDRRSPGVFGLVYLGLALTFTACAFLEAPAGCIGAALLMGALVESVRWRKFSWFPFEFFTAAPASRKFQQASLLCLSTGLFICALTLANYYYLKLPLVPAKLNLHVFYLGFSFPISLIFFSLIFERLERSARPPGLVAREICFWFLNLGVIFFFFFILFERFELQMAMAFTLFTVVAITGYLHLTRSARDAVFPLVSNGLAFLVAGSLTGIAYIDALWRNAEYGWMAGYLLGLHAALTVFGWNLSWVAIVSRRGDHPLVSRVLSRVGLHWAFVLTLPLGQRSSGFAIAAMLLGLWFLDRALFAPGGKRLEA